MAEDRTISITSTVAQVISGSIGATLTAAQLGSITAGTIVLRGGCIRHLYYQDSSEDLRLVAFDNGSSVSSGEATNLKDFRERLEDAAKYGMGATFCLDTQNRRIFMLNLYPCLCKCGDGAGRGHGQDAGRLDALSRG
jgi:hypothetical protein